MAGTQIDWQVVAADLAAEHVARLAVDTAMLRAQLATERGKLDAVTTSYGSLHEQLSQALVELADLRAERDALKEQLRKPKARKAANG